MNEVIGVDVGGTTVKAIRISSDGTELQRSAIATPQSPEKLTTAVIDLVSALRTDQTTAAGVVCPGDVRGGVVHFAANVPWRNEPVRDRVQSAAGLPVRVEWDVAAAALAESTRVDSPDVLFVSLGTGIAAAHVLDGALQRGATGRAGELGHTPVRPAGAACACGQRGCLETYASAAAIARQYESRSGTARTAEEIASRLAEDADAAAVWADAVDALGAALVTQTLMIDPGVIVLGGGLARAGDLLVAPLRTALAAGLAWRHAPPVRTAVLGESAGLIGAAELALQVSAQQHSEGWVS